MIAADANIFLRWLLDDDHAKAEQVATLFKRAEEGKVEVRAADLTLAEVVWVLGSFYELKPDAIADLLQYQHDPFLFQEVYQIQQLLGKLDRVDERSLLRALQSAAARDG